MANQLRSAKARSHPRSRSGRLTAIPRDPLRIMLALLILISVGRFNAFYGFLAALPLGKIFFGGALFYALTQPSAIDKDNITGAWPNKMVIGLGLLACISAPFGLSLGGSGVFMIEEYLKVLATFFLLIVAIRNPGDLRLFVWAYVLACGFLVYVSVFRSSLVSAGNMQRMGSLGIGLDPNDLGLVLTTGLPLALALFTTSGKGGRLACAVIILGIGASLARTGSRGGLLGLIAIGITLLFFVRQFSLLKRLTVLVAAAATLFMFAPPGYWEQMETLTNPTEDYNWDSPYGRRAIAERGLGYMLENPLTGVGIANFGRAEANSDLAVSRMRSGQGFLLTAAHNTYVQVGAELGIPGLALFLALVFGGVWGPVRLRRSLPDGWDEGDPDAKFLKALMTYLPVTMVGYAVTSFFLSFAYVDITYILIAFLSGTYLCVRFVEPSRSGRDRRLAGRRRARSRA